AMRSGPSTSPACLTRNSSRRSTAAASASSPTSNSNGHRLTISTHARAALHSAALPHLWHTMHPSVTDSLRTAAVLAPWLLTATLTTAETPPPHEVLLEALRASDAVLPPSPKEHPAAVMFNAEAVVPSQCYTRTEARSNPCYVCHQDAIEDRENVMNDADLQQ